MFKTDHTEVWRTLPTAVSSGKDKHFSSRLGKRLPSRSLDFILLPLTATTLNVTLHQKAVVCIQQTVPIQMFQYFQYRFCLFVLLMRMLLLHTILIWDLHGWPKDDLHTYPKNMPFFPLRNLLKTFVKMYFHSIDTKGLFLGY